MHLLITGGTGFVMSVLARHWLERHPAQRVTIVDAAAPDEAALRYFAPVADRLRYITGDVTEPGQWSSTLDTHDITHIVHGATITPIARGSAAEAVREPEAEMPARILDVNLMGTVALLELARTLPSLRRFLYVSSGSVYRNHGPDRAGEPLPEDGYVQPRTLYGISKLASESICERYAELFGLSVASVRLSSVYGTMDRVTPSRNYRHVPNRLAYLVAAGATKVRINAAEAVGDYVHAEDVASAIVALLHAQRLTYGVYNIASGVATSLRQLIEWCAEKAPEFRAEPSSWEAAEIQQDPALRQGMWGAYDIARIRADTGWTPRPVREAFLAYLDWVAAERRQTP